MKTQPAPIQFQQLLVKVVIALVVIVNILVFSKLAGLYSCNSETIVINRSDNSPSTVSPVKLSEESIYQAWKFVQSLKHGF